MSKTTIPFSFTINLLEIGFGVFFFIRFGIRGLLGWCQISLSLVKVCCFDFYALFIWCQVSVFRDFSLWAHWIVPKFVFLSRKFFFLFTYCSYFFQLFQICFLLVSLEVQEFSRFELFQFHFCQSWVCWLSLMWSDMSLAFAIYVLIESSLVCLPPVKQRLCFWFCEIFILVMVLRSCIARLLRIWWCVWSRAGVCVEDEKGTARGMPSFDSQLPNSNAWYISS